MDSNLRVTFTDFNDEGERTFRFYPMPNLETAKIALQMAIAELERAKITVQPNMVYLEYWDEKEEDWLYWLSKEGKDTLEFIFGDGEDV